MVGWLVGTLFLLVVQWYNVLLLFDICMNVYNFFLFLFSDHILFLFELLK